jgi:hypothetical protein
MCWLLGPGRDALEGVPEHSRACELTAAQGQVEAAGRIRSRYKPMSAVSQGQAFPLWPEPGRDAILQPPEPEIRPSPYVLERAADPDAGWEAGD